VPVREYETEVKNEWNYTSTQYISTSCAEIKPPLLLPALIVAHGQIPTYFLTQNSAHVFLPLSELQAQPMVSPNN